MTAPHLAPGDPPAIHGAAARDAIAAELVRCTLGQARHPELRADLIGVMARMTAFVRDALVPAIERFDAALSRAGAQLAADAEAIANQGPSTPPASTGATS